MSVRVRYAPSPTGPWHIGNARTGLINWLVARHLGGTFILRIEDTDRERSRPEFEQEILQGLAWLGMSYDEFYRQSDRTEVYARHLKRLADEGRIFRCPHGDPRTEKPEEPQSYAPHVCDARDGSAQTGIYRFKNDETSPITFMDIIRGEIRVDPATLGDFSVAIALDRPLFLMANTIDDGEMEISHVIRGEDHIPNTAKQQLLRTALGFPEPAWAHMPLILGSDRTKLSKRHGDASVLEFRDNGYLSAALFNFMALLGWHPSDDREVLTREELISLFSLDRMQKGGAIFDTEKLLWMNREYARTLSNDALALLLIPFLEREGVLIPALADRTFPPVIGAHTPEVTHTNQSGEPVAMEIIARIAGIMKERFTTLKDAATGHPFFFDDPEFTPSILSWKGTQPSAEIREILLELVRIIGLIPEHADEATYEKELMPFAEAKGRGNVLWPLRVALSGRDKSPGPFAILSVIGTSAAVRRITHALSLLEA